MKFIRDGDVPHQILSHGGHFVQVWGDVAEKLGEVEKGAVSEKTGAHLGPLATHEASRFQLGDGQLGKYEVTNLVEIQNFLREKGF